MSGQIEREVAVAVMEVQSEIQFEILGIGEEGKKHIFDIWITYLQEEYFAIINKRSKQAEKAALNERRAQSHQKLTAARLQFDCGSLWMLF